MQHSLLLIGWVVAFTILPWNLFGQREAEEVITSALEYRALQSFWCKGEGGEPIVNGLDPNRRITLSEAISVMGHPIPIIHDGQQVDHGIILKGLNLNGTRTRATVRFVYHDRVKARMRLFFESGQWKVKRALIRQDENCSGDEEGSRFVWDF